MYLCVGLFSMVAYPIAAQINLNSAPNTVGSGARAAGMADAFSAVADDATAASWNPAGLVQLERPEISIVSEWNSVTNKFHNDTPFDTDDVDFESMNVNFASITYPLPILIASRNSVFSITYQKRFDFNSEFDVGADTGNAGLGINQTTDFDVKQKGSLGTISPAYAIEITQNLSVGLAMNFWRNTFFGGNNGWDNDTSSDTTLTFTGQGFNTSLLDTAVEYEDFEGENFTAGLLWNISPKWNASLRYDSGFEGDIGFTETINFTDSADGPQPTVVNEESRTMEMPDSWGFGVAYRPNDRLTLALQLTRTDWNDFHIKTDAGQKISLIDGTDQNNPVTQTDFDPTHSVRFGAEYVFIPSNPDAQLNYLWTIRGGLIYDEEPASNRSTRDANSAGSGKPDRYYGFALGAGFQAFRRVNFDIAYQLRYGDDVKKDRAQGIPGYSEDYLQHRVILSSIVYF